jgi:drug/metabolite transporter (DMT)-like permease
MGFACPRLGTSNREARCWLGSVESPSRKRAEGTRRIPPEVLRLSARFSLGGVGTHRRAPGQKPLRAAAHRPARRLTFFCEYFGSVNWLARVSDRPALAAVAGAVTIAFSAILVKAAGTSPSTAAVFRCVYAVPVLALLAGLERRRYGPRSRRDLKLSLIAGAFFAADLICWAYAINDVGAGLATVLGNLQVLLVGLLAWAFLGEKAEGRVFGAIPVVLVGVVLISGAIGHGAYGKDPAQGVLFGALTGLTYSVFILVLRHGNSNLLRPAGTLFETTLACAVFCSIAGIAIGDVDFVPSWPAHGYLLLLALGSQVVGWLLISISLPRLPAALTSVLLTIQPVGSVLLGVAIFGESPSGPQIAGVAVVLAGVSVATLRPRKTAPAA